MAEHPKPEDRETEIPMMEVPKGIFECIKKWIAEHPKQTIFYVVNGVIFLNPSLAAMIILKTFGFGAAGPGSGTLASYIMAYFRLVPPGGAYATVQSAGMGGSGASAAAGAMKVGAVASSTLVGLFGRSKEANPKETGPKETATKEPSSKEKKPKAKL